MIHMKRTLFFLPLLLLAACTSAISLYDQNRWDIAATYNEDVDGDGQNEQILLLKTKETAGYGGADEPMNGVQILIAKNGKSSFSYSPNEEETEFGKQQYFTDIKSFEAEDVTGDGVKDVVFSSGQSYASDFETCTHIIVYNKEQKVFKRVNPFEFCSMFNVGISLKKIMYNVSGYQVVKSKPSNGQVTGNKVEQPFDITVYTWNGDSFSASKTFRSSRNYEGGQYAIDGEIYLIEKSMWPTMQGTTQLKDSQVQQPINDKRASVIRGFYGSLSIGNGTNAVMFVAPSKRETGVYTADGITKYWSNVDSQLELLAIDATDNPNVYQVAYQYKPKGKEICSDTATVSLENIAGEWYILTIVPVIGC